MSKNLQQRIVEVMRSMGAVGKSGQTNYGDKYAYHKIDDIDDKLRIALIEHGVVAFVEEIRDRKLDSIQENDKYGNPRTTWYAECLVSIKIVNADNPEDTMSIVGWGQGLDYGDKATGKAISYAAKAAYLSAFHLRGQPDNEADDMKRPPANHQPEEKPKAKEQTSLPAPKPPVASEKPLPGQVAELHYDKLPNEVKVIVDAVRQIDNFEALEKFVAKHSQHPMQSAFKSFCTNQRIHVWDMEMQRAKTPEEIAKHAESLKNESQEVKVALRQVFQYYDRKLKNIG